MHGRDELPTGQIPKSGSDTSGITPEEEHDFRLAGLAMATLVLLVAHAGVPALCSSATAPGPNLGPPWLCSASTAMSTSRRNAVS